VTDVAHARLPWTGLRFGMESGAVLDPPAAAR
jgi:hypothetical protein